MINWDSRRNFIIFKQFIWLEFKKWTRPIYSGSSMSIIFHVVISLVSLTFLNITLYKPLWQANPRGFVIGSMIIIFVGLFILSLLSFIIPTDDIEVVLPINPYHFDMADLSIATLSSGNSLVWALIGWFRTSLKSLWFTFLFTSIILSYCLEYEISFISYILVLSTLYLSIQSIILFSTLYYIFTEEIFEKIKPRWREANLTRLQHLSRAIIIVVGFGGLLFIASMSTSIHINLEAIIEEFWYIPPVNSIYIIVASLSKTWGQEMVIPALFSLFLTCLFIHLLFFIFFGKVDPLARLFERQPLIESLSSETMAYSIKIPLLSKLKAYNQLLFRVPLFSSQLGNGIKCLFVKDLLLLKKYKQSFIYGFTLLLHLIYFLFWLFDRNEFGLFLFFPGLLWSYMIIYFLWRMETRSFLKIINVSGTVLIIEKWLLCFTIFFTIHLPVILMQNYVGIILGIGLFHLSFGLGLLSFSIQGR